MLKNKLFASAFVLALSVVAVSASAAYTFPNKIDTKQEKMDVQTVLNMNGATLTVDGVFGAKTTAAVKAFQASKGLKADGIIGAMTRAALEAAQVTATTPVTTTVPGCPAGALFNSLTGASCAATTTTPATTVLAGGAGDLIINSTQSDVESEVTEGDTDVKVLGFKVEADGSDVALSNVKVSLKNTDTGSSTRIERYFSDVSVWMGSTKVGSAKADEFNKDGTLYTKNIALTGAAIKEGAKPYFYVTVSSVANIDSADLDSDAWKVKISDIRFTDGTGMILTDSYTQGNSTAFGGTDTAQAFDFKDLANSGDVKLTISKGSSSPVAQNVKVSDTGSTSDVLLNQFKLKATGSDMTISKLVLSLDATGTGTVGGIASEVSIKVGGSEIASNDATLSGDTTYDFTLDDDLVIKAGDTVTFDVVAKINKIDTATFKQGDSLKASYSSLTIEDKNGDNVTDKSGASIGEDQTFYSEGLNASNFTSSYSTVTDAGVVKKQTYNVSFSLTAFGNTYYIPKTIVRGLATDGGSNGLGYTVETSAGAEVAQASVTSSQSSLTSSASTVGTYFEVADGETKTFTATIELTPTASTGVAGYYHLQLANVLYDLDQSTSDTAGADALYTFAPSQNYQTSDAKID